MGLWTDFRVVFDIDLEKPADPKLKLTQHRVEPTGAMPLRLFVLAQELPIQQKSMLLRELWGGTEGGRPEDLQEAGGARDIGNSHGWDLYI